MKAKFNISDFNLDDYLLIDVVDAHSYLPTSLDGLIFRPVFPYVHSRSGLEFTDVLMQNVRLAKFHYIIRIYISISEWCSSPFDESLLPF